MYKSKIVLSSFVALLLIQPNIYAADEKVKLQKASIETEIYEETGIGSKSVGAPQTFFTSLSCRY